MDTPIRKWKSQTSLDASNEEPYAIATNIFLSKNIRVIPCRRAEFLLRLAVAPLNITLESAIADL